MNPIREQFFNIPHWAEIFSYSIQFLGVAILVARVYQRVQQWHAGQGGLEFDHFWKRIARVMKYAIGQQRIARQKYAGIMHRALFAAFILLLIGTTLAFIDYDIGELLFDVKLLQGDFYIVYKVVLDIATVVAFSALAMALYRRIILRPEPLTYNTSFMLMLWILLIDVFQGLFLESLRLAIQQPGWAGYSFAGYAVSKVILLFGFSEATLRAMHLWTWVSHVALTGGIYAIFVDLPLRHIIFSPLNVFFSSFREAGALAPLDLEDEEIEVFGVGQLQELTVMQLLDGDACTECGRCQAVCPAYGAGTALNPKEIALGIRAGIDRYGVDLVKLAGGATNVAEMPLTREIISTDALWACTTCRACVYECPVLIEHVDAIVDMRRYLVLTEGDVPDLLANAMTQAERAGNPWGNPRGSRMDWSDGLEVPVMAEKKKADVLYWVGCAGSYDPESQKTTRAMVEIFEAAGIDYAVLGEEERCNCEFARRAGNEYLFQEATHSNIAIFDKYEFKTIVTHCPHCFNTMKHEYPQFGGDYDVVHHSTYISNLIGEKYLKTTKALDQLITYHDSCYLGRYNEIYDDPRNSLTSIPGLKLTEIEQNRDCGMCCGGGGAQVWFETHQERPVNETRLDQIMATGAETVSTACPFCTVMLGSAAQSKGVTAEIAIKDIAVLVAESLE